MGRRLAKWIRCTRFMLVDCHLCTFGRFETVRRSVTQFLLQDYPDKTLLIFNTAPTPIELDPELESCRVRVINQQTNPDGSAFSSLGQVRSAALDHGKGDAWICWDDDDLFLPYHISESVRHKNDAKTIGWKPLRSLFSNDGGKTFSFAQNAMEASILVDFDFVKKHGFSTTRSGGEHVFGGWLDELKKRNELTIQDVTPSYAYIWGDGLSKTSGNIDHPNNFENHKNASLDFGQGVLSPGQFDEVFPMINRAKEFATAGKAAA